MSLEYIHSLRRFGSVLGLGRIAELCRRLGDPQRRLRFVHVAGTNGKGSVAAMCAAVLRSAGYKVGLYTSPYLERFYERMTVDGTPITPGELSHYVKALQPEVEAVAAAGEHPTEFEVITAICFLFFLDKQVDYVVLEAGLGGRFDATNVIPVPNVACITRVGYDHLAELGPTIEQIAFEKAGIIKPGGVVVSAPQLPEAARVIRRACSERGARLFEVGSDVVFQPRGLSLSGGRMNYHGICRRFDDLAVGLLGRHQLTNAATALAALETLGLNGLELPEAAVREGLAGVRWPGRFEVVGRRPWVVLDGAHNREGIEALCATVQELLPNKRVNLLFGALSDKPAVPMLRAILPLCSRAVLTRAPGPRGLDPEGLLEATREFSGRVCVEPHLPKALEEVLSAAGDDDVVLITGSLYLVGEARRLLNVANHPVIC